MEDLWPSDIEKTEIEAPVNILKEQAAKLSERTKNAIRGNVQWYDETPKSFGYTFYIKTHLLGEYRYLLFRIYYDEEMYPVVFLLDEDIFQDIFPGRTSYGPIEAKDDAEFIKILKEIFNAKKTRNVIQSILAQI